jgi:tyrosyl-tRNA synthetase
LDLFGEITKGVVFASKGEARKMIQGGGVSINKENLNDASELQSMQLLQGKYLLVQKGKKNYFIVEVN